MRQFEKHGSIFITLSVLALFWTGVASAQSSGNDVEGRSSVGAFAGFTDRNEADFTYGAEYEYRLQNEWSMGVTLEQTDDVLLGRDATVVLGTAQYRPSAVPRLKLIGGAGVEFMDVTGDDIMFRTGVGYDVFIEEAFTFTPRLSLDFGGGEERFVIGASLLHQF